MVIPAGPAFTNLFMGAIIVAALYFARDILIPVVLAVLLTFVLTPVVTFLQRWRVPRAIAVVAAMLVAVTLILSLGTMVANQVNQLATELPRYQSTLREKVQHLRDRFGTPGVFKNAADLLNDLEQGARRPRFHHHDGRRGEGQAAAAGRSPSAAAERDSERADDGALAAGSRRSRQPASCCCSQPSSCFSARTCATGSFASPARATSSGRPRRSTMPASGCSACLPSQLLLNAAFGLVIGAGLSLIGVPNAPLWGLLAMILRFVPYVGAVLCALLPILLAAAVGDGWSMALWTVLLFAVVEPLIGHVVEPLALRPSHRADAGRRRVSAVFWTWLWGPIGLLVSTPLTLCIVVLSRHVDRLKFLDIMFGDQPPLTPQQALYQRMLAGDPVEAAEHASARAEEDECVRLLQRCPARRAEACTGRSRPRPARSGADREYRHCVDELLEDLAELATPTRRARRRRRTPRTQAPRPKSSGWRAAIQCRRVVALAGRGKLDRPGGAGRRLRRRPRRLQDRRPGTEHAVACGLRQCRSDLRLPNLADPRVAAALHRSAGCGAALRPSR